MPCNSEHMRHTAEEEESGRVLELLKEIDGVPYNHEEPSYYGRIQTLDADTARLCAWLRSHDVHGVSLELQLWWQRHQKADARREALERADAEREQARRDAMGKLTHAELVALGLATKKDSR